MPKIGTWYQCLFDAKARGAYVHFETRLGVQRAGRLTNIRTNVIKINGSRKKVVDAFELNGDPFDMISFSECVAIDIDEEEDE